METLKLRVSAQKFKAFSHIDQKAVVLGFDDVVEKVVSLKNARLMGYASTIRHWDLNDASTGSDVRSVIGCWPKPFTTTRCICLSGNIGSLAGIVPKDIWMLHSLPCESNVT